MCLSRFLPGQGPSSQFEGNTRSGTLAPSRPRCRPEIAICQHLSVIPAGYLTSSRCAATGCLPHTGQPISQPCSNSAIVPGRKSSATPSKPISIWRVVNGRRNRKGHVNPHPAPVLSSPQTSAKDKAGSQPHEPPPFQKSSRTSHSPPTSMRDFTTHHTPHTPHATSILGDHHQHHQKR